MANIPISLRSQLLSLAATAALTPSLAAQALPAPPVPAGNAITPAKAVLGKILFWEEQMSSNNRVACGTCHKTEIGGGDNRRVPHPGADGNQPSPDDTFGSPGVPNSRVDNTYEPDTLFGLGEQVTGRASPSFLTGAYFPELFWDGRARTQFVDPETSAISLPLGGALESQAVGPVLSDVEMAHDLRTWGEVRTKLRDARPMALATNVPSDMQAAIAANPSYPLLFTAAFGDAAITAERIAFALATYQRSLVPDQTPWDQFQRGNTAALTPGQVRGMNAFNGPFRCNQCHAGALFSDRQFRNLGLRPIAQDLGRQAVTGNLADRGKFKVPSLRNSGLRGTFMHTGQFTNIGQVVGFYIGGGGPNQDNKDPLLLPIQPPPPQGAVADVIDFVTNALTDPRVRNRQFPFDRPTLASERIPPQGFPYGLGTAGSGGAVPNVLAAIPANIGNVDFKVGIGAARGSAPAVLAVGTAAAPLGTTFAGVNLNIALPELAQIPIALEGPAGQAGRGFGTILFPLPPEPLLVGGTLFVQWFVIDSGALFGAASSRGAELRFF